MKRAVAIELSEARVEISGKATRLEGLLLEPSSETAQQAAAGVAVVAPPHPLYGGTMTNPVVAAMTGALAGRGWRTLRFNWRGTGRSSGRASGEPGDALEDYLAALDFLLMPGEEDSPCPTQAPPVIAAGYSFGALAAALASAQRPRVGATLLLAPPVAMAGADVFQTSALPTAVVVGDSDEFAPLDLVERVFSGRPMTQLRVVQQADHFFSTIGAERLTEEIGRTLLGLRP